MDEKKHYDVGLVSDDLGMNCNLFRVAAYTAEGAEHNALALMAVPSVWRVTGVDRA